MFLDTQKQAVIQKKIINYDYTIYTTNQWI
jgi:hypothetical protein